MSDLVEKKRLDALIKERYPELSRHQIQELIKQEKVLMNGVVVTKPGVTYPDTAQLKLLQEAPKFVCRAGNKLEKALDTFKISVAGKVILDAGLSTGGFTDCLLQKGAVKVFGVDVGHNQVHEKIKNDPRVQVMEGINLRDLPDIGEQVDLVTLDLSFISVLKVMVTVDEVLKPAGDLVVLIKPQFEAGPEHINKSGVIKNSVLHEKIIKTVIEGIQKYGFIHRATLESPLLGASGNKEFLAHFVKKSG